MTIMWGFLAVFMFAWSVKVIYRVIMDWSDPNWLDS